MRNKRIVVTGLGVVSPVGSSVAKAWQALVSGSSGIGKINDFDASDLPVQIAGQVDDFNPEDYIKPKDLKKMDTFIQYGIGAAIQAIQDSGLEITTENAHRIGAAIGSGIGGLPMIEANHKAYLKGGSKKVSPFFVPGSIINMISGYLSVMCGLKGPNLALVSACTTGTHNIGEAARMINYGDADVMIAGGAEKATTPVSISGFNSARALTSTYNDNPEYASRPWDLQRCGFVLGDGAGVVVLEEYEHARARGSQIYCELAGYGMSSDAYHITQPAPGGEGAARCMKNALQDAEELAESIGYINAHATSTPIGDKLETEAIKATFGNHAQKVAISSTKSMIGHLLGAAGSVEAIITILALKNQIVPPTINLENPDPECDLDFVPNEARDQKMNVAMSNSFGFGGTNGTLLFRHI